MKEIRKKLKEVKNKIIFLHAKCISKKDIADTLCRSWSYVNTIINRYDQDLDANKVEEPAKSDEIKAIVVHTFGKTIRVSVFGGDAKGKDTQQQLASNLLGRLSYQMFYNEHREL